MKIDFAIVSLLATDAVVAAADVDADAKAEAKADDLVADTTKFC